MGRRRSGKPTFPGLIFVALGQEGEKAAQLLMAAVETFINAGDVPMMGTFEGDLSEWIATLASKPTSPPSPVPSNKNKGSSPERTAFIQSGHFLADPGNDAEQELARLPEQLSSADVEEVSEALASGDPDRISRARDSLIVKLKSKVGDITPQKLGAMRAQLMRMRELRASCLCAVTSNLDPMVLIARARQGDRKAVLDLIKIDKLFLSDGCTRDVIRNASLRADYAFFEQLGRALKFKSKMNSKKTCRLYLYVLFAVSAEIPSLPLLHFRLDPNGTTFSTSEAFERFFQRCYKTFREMDALPKSESGEPASRLPAKQN